MLTSDNTKAFFRTFDKLPETEILPPCECLPHFVSNLLRQGEKSNARTKTRLTKHFQHPVW